MRMAHSSHTAPHTISRAGGWLARRWYYTPKTRRAYSVRQVAPGDRRLLAEFALALGEATPERELPPIHELSAILFDRVLAGGSDMAVAFIALEGTAAGDRVVGVAAYAPGTQERAQEEATFAVAVVSAFRDEQVGKTLLSTLVRHARRVGIRRLSAEMAWSNRPMQMLAQSTGFTVETVAGDRGRRGLVLSLK